LSRGFDPASYPTAPLGSYHVSPTTTSVDPPSTGDLRRRGAPLTIGWAEFFGSPNNFEKPPIVNGPAHKNLLSRAFEEHRLRVSHETRGCSFRGVYILQTRRLLWFRRCGGAWSTLFHCSLTIGGKRTVRVPERNLSTRLLTVCRKGADRQWGKDPSM
jgi:hypothetical protein